MNATDDAPAILLVDDDVDACRNVSDILADCGYRVDVAHDGLAALDLARGRPYDVALLDLKMPGMDGLSLTRRLRSMRPDMVTLLVTAYANAETAAAARSTGVWRVMPKPVDVAALLQLVDLAVEQPLVLVVDDDRDLCDNLWDLLRDRDFRVGLAHDVDGATEALLGARYRLVLIDMKLPGGDGSAVFRRVREANPEARTVLITGARPETDPLVARVLAEGADAVCDKPIDPSALLALLRRLTDAPHTDPN